MERLVELAMEHRAGLEDGAWSQPACFESAVGGLDDQRIESCQRHAAKLKVQAADSQGVRIEGARDTTSKVFGRSRPRQSSSHSDG
jgi:hypothetical protein